MKFFVPHVKDKKQEEIVYEGIKRFAKENLAWEITSRRIFSIQYNHEGKEYYAEVGKEEQVVHEKVIAILESNTYLICTPNRGIVRGTPILVGKKEAFSVVDFEE